MSEQKTTFFRKLRITHKINISFALLVLLVIGLVFFSYKNMAELKSIFGDYRETSVESLLLANMSEDLAEAQLNVMKFRIKDKKEYADSVLSNIQEIVDQEEAIDKYIKNKDHHDRLIALEKRSAEYGQIFLKAKEQQDLRNVYVAKMDELGPLVRKNLSDIMETAYKDGYAVAAYRAGKLQKHFMLARYYARGYLVDNEEKDINRVLEELDTADKEVKILIAELQNPRRLKLAKEIAAGLGEYRKNFSDTVDAIKARNAFYFDGLDKVGPEVMGGYDALFEEVEAKQHKLGPQAMATMQAVSNLSIVTGMAIAVLATIIALLMGRFLKTNFAMIVRQMRRLSEGDKSFDIEGANRLDEIGEMAKTLEVFRENALEVDRMTAQQKEMEERQAEERKKTLMAMANEFEERVGGVVNNVEKAASDMQKMASILSAAVQETTSQSGAVAAASTEAAANVQTVAAAAEELSASIQEISKNVNDTAETARACARSAELSQEKLQDLQSAVEEIDSVIQSINDVAEQTNLLALNATIEAARAGEAGKGFAVVANEVKSLANKTHEMTSEISQKVSDIKSSAHETIISVTDILKQITTVDTKTTSVSAAVEEQNSSTTEISRNVQEAANGTQEVSRNIEEVQKAANDSAQSTEDLKMASDGLAGEATQLKDAVQKFLTEVRSG